MAVLLSPVAWIHHLHWMVVVVLFAVLGADPLRDRRRLVGRGGRAGLVPRSRARGGASPGSAAGGSRCWSAGSCRTPTPSARSLALGLLGWALARPAGGRAGQAPRTDTWSTTTR